MAHNPEPPLVIRKPLGNDCWPDSSSDPMWDTPEAKAHIARVAKSWADEIDRRMAEQIYREVYGPAQS